MVQTRSETLALGSHTYGYKFERFPELPTEVQEEIWKSYVIEPRIVKVRWDKVRRCCVSPTPRPALLYVCHLSRKEALKTYQKCFATDPQFATLYFNYDLDIVYFDWRSFGNRWTGDRMVRKLSQEDFDSIKTLIIHIEDIDGQGTNHFTWAVRSFVGLNCLCVRDPFRLLTWTVS